MAEGWNTVYILQRGNQYRVSVGDALTSDGYSIVEEQTVWLDESTDLGRLNREVERRCEKPLTWGGATALIGEIRGQVLGHESTNDINARYSTVIRRCGARIVDGLIFVPLNWWAADVFLDDSSTALRIAASVIGSSVPLIYRIVLHGTCGQTLGKMACRVIVLDLSEEKRLRMSQAIFRDIFSVLMLVIELAYFIPLICRGGNPFADESVALKWNFTHVTMYITLAWTIAEIVTMFANKKRRAIHDFIAGSVVIQKK